MKQLENQVARILQSLQEVHLLMKILTKQKAYNDAVQAAKDLINQTSNPTFRQTKGRRSTTKIQNAVNDLHGEQKLTQSKQDANDQLSHFNNLTDEQRHISNH